jgi:transposase
MKAYSVDLREKVVLAIEQGHGTQEKVAELFNVSVSFVESLLRSQRNRGTLEPKPLVGGRRRLVDPQGEQLLSSYVAEHPDATVQELVDWIKQTAQIEVSRPTMTRILQRLGLTRKKKYFQRRSETSSSARPFESGWRG